MANVAEIRWTPDEVDQRITAVRAWFGARGCSEFTWWLGPSSRPIDLMERLVARGAVEDPEGGHTTAMVLLREPATAVAAGVTVERVTSFEQFMQMERILFEIDDDASDPDQLRLAASLESRWDEYRDPAYAQTGFVAFVDGRPAAAGQMEFLDAGFAHLSGGATRPWARNRGCYAALVAARWEVAQSAGWRGFVVQASDMSAPILSRIGFTRTADLMVLHDVHTG
jgi:hypothetical protein